MMQTGTAALMVLLAVLTAVVPVAVMAALRRRGGRWRDFWVGAGTFFLFAMVLEQILHALVFTSPLGQVLQGNIWLYGLYGGLAAGVFEETGRFLAFKLALRNRRERIAALGYGIGHGGCEAFLVLGVTYVNNLILLYSAGSGAPLAPELAAAAESLAAFPAATFLWAGFERISAVVLHMALSVLVFTAAARPGKRWLFPAAVLIHFLLDFLSVTANAHLPLAATELLTAACALVAAYLAARLYKKLPENGETP